MGLGPMVAEVDGNGDVDAAAAGMRARESEGGLVRTDLVHRAAGIDGTAAETRRLLLHRL